MCSSVQMGELFVEAGLPDVFQLYYFWPADCGAKPPAGQRMPPAVLPLPPPPQQQQFSSRAAFAGVRPTAPLVPVRQTTGVAAPSAPASAAKCSWQPVAPAAAPARPPPAFSHPAQPTLKRALATSQQPPAAKRVASAAATCAVPKIVPEAVARRVPAGQLASTQPPPLRPAQQAPAGGCAVAQHQPAAGSTAGSPHNSAPASSTPAAQLPWAHASASAAAAPAPPPAAGEDSLLGGAWLSPSLLVTPSLLAPPEPADRQQQHSGPAPATAAASGAPASFAFAGLSLPGGGAAGGGAAEHCNWGGSLADLLSGPRLNEFGMEESCDVFAAGWSTAGRASGSHLMHQCFFICSPNLIHYM